MYFTSFSLAGSLDIPNEDWHAATSDLLVVLDGATSRTETGCEHGVAWYARKLGAAIIGNAASLAGDLVLILDQSIRDVAELHRTCDLDHPGTPSAGVAIAKLDGDNLRYLVLGDATVVLDTNDGIQVVSDQRISASAAEQRREVDRYPIGTEEKGVALLAMKHAELAARGHEYWVAAADPAAADHAVTGTVVLDSIQRLAVMTDGAARWVDLFHIGDWGAAIDALALRGPRSFIDRVRHQEIIDFAGSAHPRNKRSDDATVVYAVFPRFSRSTRPLPRDVRASVHAGDQSRHLFGSVPARNGKFYG